MTIKEIAVINIVVIVAVVGIILILSPTRNNTNYSDSRVLDQISDVVIESEMKEAFMESCAEESGYYEYCECGYNYIDKRTTMSEFLAMSLEVMDGNMPDMMWDVIDACDYLIY